MKRHLLWIPAALAAASLAFVACDDNEDDDAINGDTNGETETVTPENGLDETPDDATTPDDDMTPDDGTPDTGTPDDGNGMDDGTPDTDNGMTTSTVDLEGQNGEDMSGQATLMESDEGVDVSVIMDDTSAEGTAVIHSGTCDDDFADAEPVEEIGELDNGMADTTLDMQMDELTSEDHVVVVMNDSDEAVACGEIES